MKDRTRLWMVLPVVFSLALIAAAVVIGVLDLPLWWLLVVLVVALPVNWAFKPERSWWGDGPREMLRDPVRSAAWRKHQGRLLVLTFVVIVVATFVLEASRKGP